MQILLLGSGVLLSPTSRTWGWLWDWAVGRNLKDSEVSVRENLKHLEDAVSRNLDSEELLVRALRGVSNVVIGAQRKGESRCVAAECFTISCSYGKRRKCT